MSCAWLGMAVRNFRPPPELSGAEPVEAKDEGGGLDKLGPS